MPKLSPALDAATTYAGHGLKSFPLKPRSKQPATEHGFKDATLDGGLLHRRFTAAGADANVGIATGDGLIVLDLDGPKGADWLDGSDYELPRTWTARTGRGRHLYFTVGRPVRTTPTLGPQVDVKGEGGYVVAPPSIHPDGTAYAWSYGPTDGPIAPAPAWLLALLDEPRAMTSPSSAPTGAPFPEGGRNSGLAAEAGRLRRRGLSQAALEVELQEINRARCSPPLPDDEVRTIARSVGRYLPDPVAVADERLQARAAERPQATRSRASGARSVSPAVDDTAEAVSDGIIGRRASEVQSKAVRWLWKGRLPAGMLVILDGDPGLGKSTIIADWIARVTTGAEWPDGEQNAQGGAIYVGAEDPEEEVVVPRLRAAGADLERVQLVRAIPTKDGKERSLILPQDLALLKAAITEVDARLLVFDPIVSYIAKELSSYSDMEVRQALTPLGRMLADTNCCGVMLRHLKKDEKVSLGMYRGGGSIAFVALARAGFAVGKLKGKDGALALMPTKANLAPKPASLRYTLEQVELDGPIETSRVVWGGELEADADEVLTAFGGDREKPREKAEELLQEMLADGPRPSSEIEAEARARGISVPTLRRAKDDLGVRNRQPNGDGKWWNALPEHAHELSLVGAVRGADGRLYGSGGRGTEGAESQKRVLTPITESDHPYSEVREDVSTHPYNDAVGSGAHAGTSTRARARGECPEGGPHTWASRQGRRYCTACLQWERPAA